MMRPRHQRGDVGTGVGADHVVIQSGAVDLQTERLVVGQQPGFAQGGQIEGDQRVGVHADPLLDPLAARVPFASSANGAAALPAIVDNRPVAVAGAAELAEVE